jgi:hypothetical protein
MLNTNIDELKEKAKSENVLDKLKNIYSLLDNIKNKNQIYTEVQSFKNIELALEKLLDNKDLTRHLGKRNLESYMTCREQSLYMLEQLNIYEKELQELNSKEVNNGIDLSYTIISANITEIIVQLKAIVQIVNIKAHALAGNKN